MSNLARQSSEQKIWPKFKKQAKFVMNKKNFEVSFLLTFDCFYLKLFSAGRGYVEDLAPPPPSPRIHCPDIFKNKKNLLKK